MSEASKKFGDNFKGCLSNAIFKQMFLIEQKKVMKDTQSIIAQKVISLIKEVW